MYSRGRRACRGRRGLLALPKGPTTLAPTASKEWPGAPGGDGSSALHAGRTSADRSILGARSWLHSFHARRASRGAVAYRRGHAGPDSPLDWATSLGLACPQNCSEQSSTVLPAPPVGGQSATTRPPVSRREAHTPSALARACSNTRTQRCERQLSRLPSACSRSLRPPSPGP